MTASDDGTARVWRPFAPGVKPVVLRGHKREVIDAEFSPDGTRVVTASLDGTARLWDSRTGKEVTIPLVHGDAVAAATFSPDGARVVTASADQTARIWDSRTGTELAVLRGHDNYVGGAEFSPDGKRVVTSSFDQHGARLGRDRSPSRSSRSGMDGFRVASAASSPPEPQLVATSSDGPPRVLNPEDRRRHPLATSDDHVVNAVFSADGRDIVTWDAKGGVRAWNPTTGSLRTLEEAERRPHRRRPEPGRHAHPLPQPSLGRSDHHGRPLGPHRREARRDMAPRRPGHGSRIRRERTPLPRLDRGRSGGLGRRLPPQTCHVLEPCDAAVGSAQS